MNNSGIDASRIYFLGTGSSLTGVQHFLQPDTSTGVCSYALPATNNSADSDISVKLSDLPTSGTNTYLIYLPQQISGRCYLSIDYPLYLQTTTTTIAAPSFTNPSDPSYYTLYQNFELTLDVNYELYSNVSNVDLYSLPMGLASFSYPSGDSYTTLDGLTASGFAESTTRSSILSTVVTGLTDDDHSTTPEWLNLVIPYYDNPYTDNSPATDLRILAAKNSIGFATGVFLDAKFPQGAFNSLYLQSTTSGPTSGQSYMDDLGAYYNTPHTTTFTVYPGTPTIATYSMTGTSATDLHLTSSSSGAATPVDLNLSNLTTVDLLGGDVGAWNTSGVFTPALDADNTGCYTEIAKLLSALFSAGQLPPDSTLAQPILSADTYFTTYRGDYFSNPTGFTEHGPWYNLFDSLMHPLMVKTNSYGLGYAYDYDDLLALGGEMHVVIGTGRTTNTDYPYYELFVGPIDTDTPDPKSSFGPYTLTLNPITADSGTINIIYTTTPGQTPSLTQAVPEAPSGPFPISNVYDYFVVEYVESGNSYNVYPKHQLVQPTTTRYSSVDVPFMSGISFTAVTGSGTSFTMSFPDL